MKRTITKMFIACDICNKEIESKERLDRINFKVNGKQKGFDMCWRCSEKMTDKFNKLLVSCGKEAYDFDIFIPKKIKARREAVLRAKNKKLAMNNEDIQSPVREEDNLFMDEENVQSPVREEERAKYDEFPDF